jgi:RNA polymerase sigma-70 factor, ECF subfamily
LGNNLLQVEADMLVNEAAVKLISRCKKNDEDAYNQLLSQYEAYLYQLCYNYTRNKEEALDMMQEVYIKIFRGIKTFDETRPLLPWMKRIAINTMINQGKKTRPVETSLDGNWSAEGRDDNNRQPESFLAADTDIEEEVIYGDTRNFINRLIGELPDTYRAALTLRYHEEMSYEEIASALEQPLGTVKNSVYRARKILWQKMKNYELLEV